MKFLTHIEEKWQKKWENKKIFEADPDPNRKKCFVTFPYSYANGPLHVGHGFTATRVDVYARFKRMQGYNVLFPWAWHWTGETIAGASERIKQGDKSFIRALTEIDGVPEEELEKLVNPVYMASYYTNENRETVKRAGFSIDWRREFHTTSPTFNKFIEWQYKHLREKGYVVKGTHPVVWCPHCQSPTGDADRQEGEGVSPEEYTLIKFEFENSYLPAATFRPETIYAVTNMWIHPDAHYVEAQVDDEKWIVSKVAAEKLKEQKRNVKIIREFKGREIVGKNFVNPINKQSLPILPGWFVNPKNGTGVVYSVPAHAPYDWLALRDLQRNPESLREFGVDASAVKSIEPISMIQVEGFGEYPAVEIVEQLEVKYQNDPKAEEATKTLYKKEFHGGVLKQICGEYAGKMVREVKEPLIQNFKRKNIADSMYDLPQPVVCRCLTPCIVKVLEGQWFLKYSDNAWKEKTKEALTQISIYPKTAEQWFITIIDWLREWACARKTGLGTPLPWSPDWVVETLSDSTVYMAFYTINKHVTQHDLTSEQLTPEVLDYIFQGEGNINNVAENSRISPEILESMRNEFLYWYPVDLRVSGKELVPNHLTFYIFHHVALFPPEHWPKAIGVNGMLMSEGNKMSKSKGNFVTLKSAIEQYGADPTRCALLLGAEEMDDPDWRKENVRDVRNKIESFYKLAENIVKTAEEEKTGHLEKWLTSRLQHQIKTVTESLEEMKTRTAVETALFEVWKDIRWYTRRKGTANTKTLKKTLNTWVRLLAPFIPHICEEIWNKMHEEELVSSADWPKYNDKKVNIQAEENELLIKNVFSDTQNIIQATKIKPKKICYYVATPWKWKAYLTSLKKAINKRATVSSLMKELTADPELKKKVKDIAKFIPKILNDVNQASDDKKQRRVEIGILDENMVLKEAKSFFQREFDAEIYVYQEANPQRYDPKQRSRIARPYRPAIYIE
ncbi:MAG: leucine--tRNA ligase [Thermoproteota archaeon]|nr:leucine--tRNA ligase [Thermoproteota archaeon]